MLLILAVAFGIVFGYRAMARVILPIPCAISDMYYSARTSDRFRNSWQRYCYRRFNAVDLALLMALVAIAIGVTELQSQINVPAKSPPTAEAWLIQGETLSGNQQYDKAIAAYTAAIELKPDYAEAYNDRGFAYYLKGDFKRAISDYTRAIELRPNYPKAYNSRGVAYMQGGYGAAQSVPDFDRAIELKPDFRYAYINRANARFLWHPLLALKDFHRAGMHPEWTVGIVACVFLVFALVIVFLVLRRKLSRGL